MPRKKPQLDNKTINRRAFIYSAFIFPGAGLFILDVKKQAWAMCGVTLTVFVLVLVDSILKAHRLADQFISGLMTNGVLYPDKLLANLPSLPGYIRDNLGEVAGFLPSELASILSYSLLILWLVGLVLTYYYRKVV